jgi:hypothetical protein
MRIDNFREGGTTSKDGSIIRHLKDMEVCISQHRWPASISTSQKTFLDEKTS